VGLDKTSELEYYVDALKRIYGLGEATIVAIECTEFCQALADDTRQRILEMLLEKEMCAGGRMVVSDYRGNHHRPNFCPRTHNIRST
jgi:hypothetical protein